MYSILKQFGVEGEVLKKLEGYGSSNFLIEGSDGKKYVLKKYPIKESEIVREEIDFINLLDPILPYSLPTNISTVQGDSLYLAEDSCYRLSNYIEGSLFVNVEHTDSLVFDFGQKVALFHSAVVSVSDSSKYLNIKNRQFVWNMLNTADNDSSKIQDASLKKLVDYFILSFNQNAITTLKKLPRYIHHNDLNDWNVLCDGGKVIGVIDFGDISFSPLINDIGIALAYLLFNKENPIACAESFIKGYVSKRSISKEEIALLFYLIPARLCTSLCGSAKAKFEAIDTEYILVSEKPAKKLLNQWIAFNPIHVQEQLLLAAGLKSDIKANIEAQLIARRQMTSNALKLSYDSPIYFNNAVFQYMHDKSGNRFLDAYNNIPHVGHCHPRITNAIAKQSHTLNTNTRYIYDGYASYAEQLLAYFPKKLNKVLFVNSGSAASDLAIRVARNYTQRSHQLVLEHGYHGNTALGIEISAYKFDGHGGSGAGSSITTLPLPKTYNGHFKTGVAYGEDAVSRIQNLVNLNKTPSSLIVECISGCGGQMPIAPEYLKTVLPILQENNILLIADEVQTGFGRLGQNYWAFEMQDVIPDIVILGKPMGNGHPIGAVITTTEIADSFDNGMEFFSSFGGNPISCAVGETVLSIIEDEQLQANAKATGSYYLEQLNQLKSQYPVIADVRGKGLFIGIEFSDPERQTPKTDTAQILKNRLRELHVLTSTDGPYNNVIKSKPPLCFNKQNVDEVVSKMDSILKQIT